MVRWLALSTFTAGVLGLIPGWETKIPQAVQHRQKKREKKKRKEKPHKNKQKTTGVGKNMF